MKRAYIEPQTVVLNIEDESALCAGTNPTVGGQIKDPDYENIINTPIGEGEGEDDVPITAKGGDFFEESISPSSSSIWGDED